MQTKYEELLERSIKCQQVSNDISKSLLKVSENLEINSKQLNDEFVLHKRDTEDIQVELKEVRQTLLKWIKYLAIALFIAVGGTSILKMLVSGELSKLF